MSKYELLVQRVSEHKNIKKPNSERIEDSTLSNVTLTNKETNEVMFKCFCCENIGPSTDESKKDKRIVARTYQLRWTSSSKNGSLVKKYPEWSAQSENGKALVKDGTQGANIAIHVVTNELPSFAARRILIHVGNYPQDTEGCLLLGYSKGEGTVSNSIECCKDFMKVCASIDLSQVSLVVKEIE